MLLVSACLCGLNCKYNGGNNLNPYFRELMEEKKLIPICPEVLAGLKIPRRPSEIWGGSGNDVLDAKARVINNEGIDLSQFFLKGAQETLATALECKADRVVLKSRSPSCGVGQIYDGSFNGILRPGDGVTAALLKKHGFKVVNDEDFLRAISPEKMIKNTGECEDSESS
ncbi:MAG: DUF523 domain-containing protein [Syntrophomonadaceae bacterium]|nr:DUF523 domain-containing protein [Syntrophomonadaceae bacterium]